MTTRPGRGDRTSERDAHFCRPFRASIDGKPIRGCTALAPGYSLRPLQGLPFVSHDVSGRKRDRL